MGFVKSDLRDCAREAQTVIEETENKSPRRKIRRITRFSTKLPEKNQKE